MSRIENTHIEVDDFIVEQCFKIEDITYTWFGGMGSVMHSKERGVLLGDTRTIKGFTFRAYMMDKGLFKNKVHWAPKEKVDQQWIRDFKKAIFS